MQMVIQSNHGLTIYFVFDIANSIPSINMLPPPISSGPVNESRNQLPDILCVIQLGYGSTAIELLSMYFEGQFTSISEEDDVQNKPESSHLIITKATEKAAQETGALNEEKDKLEKQLEELGWRLQLEKRLRTDLEEEKAQEALKFQNSLEAMQKKLDEVNALAVMEREAAKKTIDEATAVVEEKEIVIEDTKKIESLTAEVDE
ncbi:unnamed protein product [Lactuca virosa]|uniref:N-acetyltransferase domain-containing protein n=1 Tax=Lactuca virosa TaxID=75947 RepID=A0AAU9M6R4_9ASTR|nr:unnamed protein product [Lactuca virosa]